MNDRSGIPGRRAFRPPIYPGRFVRDDEPTSDELAEVERIKAEIRGEHMTAMLEKRDGEFRDARDGPVAEKVERPVAAGNGQCPTCNAPYGKYRRCYKCNPPNPPKTPGEPTRPRRATLPAVAIPPVAPAPAIPHHNGTPPLSTAVRAMRGVVDLLAALDDDEARWVIESAFRLSRK